MYSWRQPSNNVHPVGIVRIASNGGWAWVVTRAANQGFRVGCNGAGTCVDLVNSSGWLVARYGAWAWVNWWIFGCEDGVAGNRGICRGRMVPCGGRCWNNGSNVTLYPLNFGAEFQRGETKILSQIGDGKQAVTRGWAVGKHVVVAYLKDLAKLDGIVRGGAGGAPEVAEES
jgi:hypothetical protein